MRRKAGLRSVQVFGLLALLGCGCGRVGYDEHAVVRDAAPAEAPAPSTDGAPDGLPVDGVGMDQATGPFVLPATESQLSNAGSSTCAIRRGTLYCWGDNLDFALGLGDRVARTSPVQVGPTAAWVQVKSTTYATCGIQRTGALWCWGRNDAGQLGLGDTTTRMVPTQVGTQTHWRSVFGRYAHFLATDASGGVWGWGANGDGQTAVTGGGDAVTTPTRILTAWNDVTALATGAGHSCVLRGGPLWCWGRNAAGQLGQGSGAPFRIDAPVRVGMQSDWFYVAASMFNTCAIRMDGSLWCTGGNADMLVAPTGGEVTTMQRVSIDADWASVSVGPTHACGIKRGGALWCWGKNGDGQLGLGDLTDRTTPTRVGTATDWAEAQAGRLHTCARKRDGAIWCAGGNDTGALGVGDTTRRTTFTMVPLP